nr:nanos-like protein 1-like [Biomphalaria glabrata]
MASSPMAMDSLTIDEIWKDFRNNGVTVEMDEFDWIQFNSRRRFINSSEEPITEDDIEFQEELDKIRLSLRRQKPLGNKKHCVFCKNNKEDVKVYATHLLKHANGDVICPILKKYTCPMCSATGTKAHTVKYCPLNDGLGTVDYIVKTPIGRKRF